jgi:hypothetical protein
VKWRFFANYHEFQRALVAPLKQRLAAEDDSAQKGQP